MLPIPQHPSPSTKTLLPMMVLEHSSWMAEILGAVNAVAPTQFFFSPCCVMNLSILNVSI